MTAKIKEMNAGDKVLAGLKRIEYRGYDSWGVVVLTKQGFKLVKRVGKLSNLGKLNLSKGLFALGHTRWATHGGVTQVNAHPHLAKDASFALAQNGVVENYQSLREKLLDAGYSFDSETDTEVIVGLIEQEMKIQGREEPDAQIIRKVFLKLTGRNTIAILTKSGNLYAVRNGSPLVVGKNSKSGDIYFSSDVISMSGDVDEYIIIKSGQLVEYLAGKLLIRDLSTQKPVLVKFTKMTLEQLSIDKEGYDSFMLKEIHEQAKVMNRVGAGKESQFRRAVKLIKKAKTVFVVGAGTASFAAGHVAYLFRKLGINAMSIASYEADSYRKLFTKDSLGIIFSQSGETADTNEVVEWMKAQGVKIISAVNMPGSTLTQLSDLAFMLDVGPELAVASTKAFFAQMLWGMTTTALLEGFEFSDLQADIIKFEQALRKWFANTLIQEKIRKLAISLARKKHLFVLGRGDLYSSSLESALKLKEISYIHAEGFSGGELKHGVIALVEQGTPVLCLVAEDENKSNMLNTIAEVNARGGYTIVVASEDNELYKEWLEVPELKLGKVNLITLTSIVPAQLLTCYMAMRKHYDVDKPRNLAKSVTVK